MDPHSSVSSSCGKQRLLVACPFFFLESESRNPTAKPNTTAHETSTHLQSCERVELRRGNDHGCAVGYRGQVTHNHPKAVVERDRDADLVRVRQQNAASDQVAIVQNVAVREAGTL